MLLFSCFAALLDRLLLLWLLLLWLLLLWLPLHRLRLECALLQMR